MIFFCSEVLFLSRSLTLGNQSIIFTLKTERQHFHIFVPFYYWPILGRQTGVKVIRYYAIYTYACNVSVGAMGRLPYRGQT